METNLVFVFCFGVKSEPIVHTRNVQLKLWSYFECICLFLRPKLSFSFGRQKQKQDAQEDNIYKSGQACLNLKGQVKTDNDNLSEYKQREFKH